MKDIIITSKTIKRERNFYLLSFILAFLINVGAVIGYTRPWTEIFSQIGYVVVISIFTYFLLWVPRGIIIGICYFFRKRK